MWTKWANVTRRVANDLRCGDVILFTGIDLLAVLHPYAGPGRPVEAHPGTEGIRTANLEASELVFGFCLEGVGLG